MNQDTQLKLQAYLDGELPPGEAKVVADLIAGGEPARALLTELTNTKAAVGAYEGQIQVPVARDFYWSGIRREIERQEQRPQRNPPEASLFAKLRRMLVPASGLVAVVLAVMLAGQSLSSGPALIDATETMVDDSDAFTYRDHSSGTTLVWVSYPAENEFAEMDLDDILDLY